MRVLVTGAAGFIGFHVSRALLERGDEVVGFDNLSDYYDVALKQARLAELAGLPHFRMIRGDLADDAGLAAAFATAPQRVVHLAAQAGVRASITSPKVYGSSNLVGFLNIVEACRHAGVEHLVYASSSSVYGVNTAMPFSLRHSADHPVSLYGATKRANELMAHAYSHLYDLPTTGLRFFTVYGPWGRPDMAPFLFTRAILAGEPLDVFNDGRMQRDFTYIDDVVDGVVRVLDRAPVGNPDWSGDSPDRSSSRAPYALYNIGGNKPIELLDFIGALERALGRKATLNLLPMQPGDVPATFADVTDLARDVGFAPSTPLGEGVARFVAWYRDFYRV